MAQTTTYVPGTFCWVDLSTPDAAAAKNFYTQLFGWTADDMPAGPDMIYTMLLKDGKEAAALSESKERPPFWQSYVSVGSVDDVAAKVEGLGGKVVMAPFDVLDVGRMAVLQDPTGATFNLWEARKHHGAGIVNVPGSFVWNELMTTDTAAASQFYKGLLGWESRSMDVGMAYTLFHCPGSEKDAGGMMKVPQDAGMPSMWIVYFAVEDADAVIERAQSLGGTLLNGPIDIPSVGRFAILLDPQGAVFAVIRTEMAAKA